MGIVGKHKKHIKFTKANHFNPKGKTCVWEVFATNNPIYLGIIKWYPQWRQYCFFPAEDSLYNVSCLNDIVEFIKANKDMRK